MGIKTGLMGWRQWIQKGGFAVADQALFAGTNFVANILLARWMAPEAYGAFVTTYAIFLLVGTLHTALVTEPMLIFGAGKYARSQPAYLGILTLAHLVITGLASLLLVGISLLLAPANPPALTQALLGLAISTPFMLGLWLTRRAFYLRSQPQGAAAGGGLYLGLMLLTLYGLNRLGLLSPFSALMVMGTTAAITGAGMLFFLAPRWRAASPRPKEVLSQHWAYGKWSIPVAFLNWVPSNIFYTLLPAVAGLAASGSLRALVNLIMPVLQATSAIAVLLIPSFVQAFTTAGQPGLQQRFQSALAVFLGGSVLYYGLIVLFGPQLMHLLYAGQYDAAFDSLAFLLIGIIPLFTSLNYVAGSALRALERIDLVFKATAIAMAVAVPVGFLLLVVGGLQGTVVGLCLAYAANGLSLTVAYRKVAATAVSSVTAG